MRNLLFSALLALAVPGVIGVTAVQAQNCSVEPFETGKECGKCRK